jgi:nucleoside-diphosphate-sugar epimerase
MPDQGSNTVKRIAIIGAAGYVGMELARELRGSNYEVNAIVRGNGQFLLRDSGFNLIAPSDLGTVGKVDVVVNLAYPSGPQNQYPLRNREILQTIRALMGPQSCLIHVSTQAVFGFGMDRPVVVGPVTNVRDYGYIEAKVELENLLLREYSSQCVQVVRLGNVWGPGSAWAVPMVSRILFGEPVGVEGVDGYCNATDVANAASYLAYLIAKDDLRGIEFHHLAEMSRYRWSSWIKRIEESLGVEAVYEPILPAYPTNLMHDIRPAVSSVMPGPLYRKLVYGRFSASWLRSLVRTLGDARFSKVKKISPKPLPSGYRLGEPDEMFLTILSAQVQFETSVLADWTPPVDFEESWSRIEHWMNTAGYAE